MAQEADEEIEITPQMVEAGVIALSSHCPIDVAFRLGGEREAVEAVLRAALEVRPNRGPLPTS